jgi:hypothetical protein
MSIFTINMSKTENPKGSINKITKFPNWLKKEGKFVGKLY